MLGKVADLLDEIACRSPVRSPVWYGLLDGSGGPDGGAIVAAASGRLAAVAWR